MSRVYRVLRKKYARAPFDGEGAYRYGGRWSSPGTRLGYTSEHQSLAMLEYFVHLDKDDPPDDLVLAVAEIPDDLTRQRIEPRELPENWRDAAAPPELARLGDEFVQRGEQCLLLVPSVLAPGENNCLVNPEHPDYRRIEVGELESLSYDPRTFAKNRSRPGRRLPVVSSGPLEACCQKLVLRSARPPKPLGSTVAAGEGLLYCLGVSVNNREVRPYGDVRFGTPLLPFLKYAG